jgi:two-component system, OmpR family, sensor histidine kinase CiaH
MANNSILQSSELGQNSSTKQWLDSTDQESNRMLELIDNMLNLARLDDPAKTREQVRKTFTRINFSEIVEEISLQFESVAFDKNAIFETDIEEDIYVFANVDNIRNTVGVLLENSCKYAQGKDVITIKLNSDNKKCTFSVKNKNSYISDEDLPHIFERFYRCSKSRSKIDNTNEDIKHGHGLGLAIAKATIEEADGTINVTSSSDGGTTFTTTLPLSK